MENIEQFCQGFMLLPSRPQNLMSWLHKGFRPMNANQHKDFQNKTLLQTKQMAVVKLT